MLDKQRIVGREQSAAGHFLQYLLFKLNQPAKQVQNMMIQLTDPPGHSFVLACFSSRLQIFFRLCDPDIDRNLRKSSCLLLRHNRVFRKHFS